MGLFLFGSWGKGALVGTLELIVIAVGLSMDAFAVSIGKGLSVSEAKGKHAIAVGLYFGGFQALMPLLGYLLGAQFGPLITSYDHWIAFVLLAIIGARMIHESRSEQPRLDDSFDFKAMFPLAIATSIDALAAGVSFAFLGVDIVPAIAFIGVITFGFSVVGLKLGNVFGSRNKARAELFGGLVLIAIGTKVLLEHLGLIA